MKRITVLMFLLVSVLTVMAQTKKVALLETLNGDKSVQVKGIEINMVRGELRKAISNQQGFQAFTRTDVDQLMKEHGFQNSGMVSDSQRKRLGEMSGADFICVSTLTKSDTEFYLEAYLIDVETGEISNPATQYGRLEGGTYANLFQICQDLAQELIGYVDSSGGHVSAPTRSNRPQSQGSEVITITVNGVSFEMIKVEAGSFIMGCTLEQGDDCYDDEKPYHRVTISRDYYIGKYEVTQELWEAVIGTNPSRWKSFDLPVENVSWNDAREFCTELSGMTGRCFRLPTEAEWEYAARGGKKSTNSKFSGSSNMTDVAWCTDNSAMIHSVGKLSPNELGIFDMNGNVAEWCQDWFGDYSSASQTDPQGPSYGSFHVLRGGSYGGGVKYNRVCSRADGYRDYLEYSHGFRLVLEQ